MTLEIAGPVLAVTTVATIAAGHELVRRVNYHFGTWPSVPLFLLGIGVLVGSLWVPSTLFSAVMGIVGLTTVVDGYEVLRQEKRILKGHAPENPERPVRRPE